MLGRVAVVTSCVCMAAYAAKPVVVAQDGSGDFQTVQAAIDAAGPGYVFNHCRLTAEPGAARVYLGRPWRTYASVVFLNTYMGPEIVPAGWLEWEHDGKPSLPTAFYAEYGSQGPGARPAARDPHAVQLTREASRKFEVLTFLSGDDGWDPTQVR